LTMKRFLITICVVFLSVGSNAFQISPIRKAGTISHLRQCPTSPSNALDVTAPGKVPSFVLRSSPQNDDMIDGNMKSDVIFDGQTTISLVGAQSLLVVGAIVAANILNVPNNGLGEGFLINTETIQSGVITTLPLFVLAFVLDFVEKKVPALQDVTKATQRSVLGKIL